MSRIDELIAELCPEGVEFKELGEVAQLQRGTSITSKDIKDGYIPVIAGGQQPAYFHNVSNRDGETIVVAGSGAYSGFVSYWVKPIFVSDAFSVKPDNSVLLTKYAFYFLKENQTALHDLKRGGGVPHVYAKDISPMKVPIPPLEIQREIVRVLDTFTRLESELESELEARRRQHQYYRDRLLSFESGRQDISRIDDLIAELCPEGVEFKTLANVAAYSVTRINASDLDETTFVGVDNLLPNMAGKTNATYTANTARLTAYEIGDILLGNIRPYLKKIWLASNSGGCSGDVLAVRIAEAHRPALMPEFLYRLLASEDFFTYNMKYAKGAKMPRGSKEAILKYRIPIPPLEIQREIVRVLDTFTRLEAELKTELKTRQRQYQHYRDRLLTFQEAA